MKEASVVPIVGAVDHGAGDVLIHEEQQRETESKTHGTEDCRPAQVPQWRRFEYLAVYHFELVHCGSKSTCRTINS